jgi:hypothetical protein
MVGQANGFAVTTPFGGKRKSADVVNNDDYAPTSRHLRILIFAKPATAGKHARYLHRRSEAIIPLISAARDSKETKNATLWNRQIDRAKVKRN